MKRFFVRLLALIGGLFIAAVLVGIAVALAVQRSHAGVPRKTVLELDLETALAEYIPDDPVAQLLLKDRPTVREVVEGLDWAANDERVVGLVATVGNGSLGMAQIQEVRDAIQAFRAKKKPAVAFSETFGEAGQGSGAYYLATAFDEIWLQPSGDVGLVGVLLESPFIRGALDKAGVVPRFDQRYEYKEAMNVLTERKFTAAHREASEKLAQSWYGQIVRGIAEGRRLSAAEVRGLVDKGPYLGAEALNAKLVDGLAYRDEVFEKVRKKAGDGAQILYLSKYIERARRPPKGKAIALIYGVGTVSRGKSGYNPASEGFTMGSDTVSAAFRAAIEDKDVKAILFRVDSPGGSYVASDTVWRETVRARKAGKPVVVSMGDLAGSGGYFVAMAADKIVAQPGTITASIGVLGGKFLTTALWDKLGITWDEVHAGANADIFTGTRDFSPAEWARFQASLDRVYADFTGKVAEGRGLAKEKVLEVAKGRIWTGEDAKDLGLVDELGGYTVALRLAKVAAKIPPGDEVRLKIFPPKKNPLDKLLGEGPDNSEKAVVAAAVRTAEALQPLVRRLRGLGLMEEPGVLTMPVSPDARP